MIFSCGYTREEQDRRDGEWHRFFPLFPRTVALKDGRHVCAWLQWIERRATKIIYWEGRDVYWDYRLPPSDINEVRR